MRDTRDNDASAQDRRIRFHPKCNLPVLSMSKGLKDSGRYDRSRAISDGAHTTTCVRLRPHCLASAWLRKKRSMW